MNTLKYLFYSTIILITDYPKSAVGIILWLANLTQWRNWEWLKCSGSQPESIWQFVTGLIFIAGFVTLFVVGVAWLIFYVIVPSTERLENIGIKCRRWAVDKRYELSKDKEQKALAIAKSKAEYEALMGGGK